MDWPLILRPVWYFYEQVNGIQRGVLLVGNPAIMWGGLLAVGICLCAAFSGRDRSYAFVAGLYLFSILIWVVIPKEIGFYYYYHMSSIFLCVALAAVFHKFCASGWVRVVPVMFVVTAVGLFSYFYPIIAALPLAESGDFMNWMWWDNWR